MPLARELRRGRILQRRAQEKRNAEAQAEEAARQAALSGGVKMERTRAPANKMQPAPENKAAPPFSPLVYAEAVVPFASDRARELAAELGLGASYFAGRAYSGASGFTTADVRRIAEVAHER